MTDIMLDLETWGTRPGCALRSIGACVFKRDGDGTEPIKRVAPDLRIVEGTMADLTFYRNISRASCEAAGLVVDPDTEAWWAKQSQAAADALVDDQGDLTEVVGEFHNWFRAVGGEYLWCQGANFDEPIWVVVALAAGRSRVPWKFFNVRDTRTVYDLCGFDPRSQERSGEHHTALGDAQHQAKCVQRALSYQNSRTLPLKTDVEVQSGLDRIRFAEGLIQQLPDTHDGRNTWLMNYGTSEDDVLRRASRGLDWNESTQAARTE